MSGEPRIALRGVHKRFGAKEVLRGVDLAVAPGESLAIIGGSGTGKSVSLKCVLGVVEPDSGVVAIDGVDITRLRGARRDPWLRRMGVLFQGGALFDSLSVWENIAFRPLITKTLTRKEAYALAVEKLEQVGLGEREARLAPAELSGGMQKRVGLARAVANDPEILLFDEPTTGLDPITTGVINALIRDRVRSLAATALSITHDMRVIEAVADKVALLHQGRVVWAGGREDMANTDDPHIRQFMEGAPHGPLTAPAP